MFLPEEKKEFELCPEGNHLAICTRVIDLGTQEQDFEGETKHQRKIYISWELADERRTDGEAFFIGNWYTFSSDKKSNLRKDLESWRGRKFKDEDFGPGGFNIKNLLLVPCFLQVIHKESAGKTTARVQSIGSLPKGVTKPPTDGIETIYFSLDSEPFDLNTFSALPEWMQEVIQKSPEWGLVTSAASKRADSVQSGKIAEEFEDDEIPF